MGGWMDGRATLLKLLLAPLAPSSPPPLRVHHTLLKLPAPLMPPPSPPFEGPPHNSQAATGPPYAPPLLP